MKKKFLNYVQIQNWSDEIGTVNHVQHHMQKTFVNKSVVFYEYF